jgi:hypothetical protein
MILVRASIFPLEDNLEERLKPAFFALLSQLAQAADAARHDG